MVVDTAFSVAIRYFVFRLPPTKELTLFLIFALSALFILSSVLSSIHFCYYLCVVIFRCGQFDKFVHCLLAVKKNMFEHEKKTVELCNAKKCQREKINVLFVFHRSSHKWNSLIALCNSPLFIRPNQISVKNNAESEENTGIVDFCLGFSILNQFSCCNSAIDRLCNRLNDRCETEHTMEIDLDELNRKTKFLNFFPTRLYKNTCNGIMWNLSSQNHKIFK